MAAKKQQREIRTVADLTPDPRNARKHTKRNLNMIEDSLRDAGPWRSISIDEDGVVFAGNGVVEAAGQIGIEKVTVVDAQPNEIVAVRRTGLTEEQKRRYALRDNHAGDLADYDAEILRELGGLTDGIFGDDELAEMFEDADMEAILAEQIESERAEDKEVVPKRVEIRPVIVAEHVDVFERAMDATGIADRGEALIAVCRAYLGEDEKTAEG